MRMNKILLVLFFCFLLIGSSKTWGLERDLFTDPSKLVEIKIGEDFYIAVAANPTTGYSWKMTGAGDSKRVKFIGENYQPDNSGLVGAGGAQWFHFLAQNAGETEIKLLYSRPWESKEAPVKNATFKVKIS